MIALIQRVSRASVTVADEVTGEIGPGLLVLLGVEKDDDEQKANRLCERVLGYRIFSDAEGKTKFLKLDSHHIEFVMDCLRDNTTKVRNIKQYLRAMLFNAPSTINSYYASLVAHDMAQPDWGRPPNN